MKRGIASVVLGLLAIIWLAVPADARWTAAGTGTETARSATVTAPGLTAATCNSLVAASVRVDWLASTTPSVTQYEVRWGTNPTAPTNAALVTGLSFSTPDLSLGTWYFTVRSVQGTWRSPTANQPSKLIISVLGLGTCV